MSKRKHKILTQAKIKTVELNGQTDIKEEGCVESKYEIKKSEVSTPKAEFGEDVKAEEKSHL